MDHDLLTTAQAAAHADRARQLLSGGTAHIRPTTIRDWASRGHLTRAGLTAEGHPVYRLGDVARAELGTRGRALRLVGMSTSAARPGPIPSEATSA